MSFSKITRQILSTLAMVALPTLVFADPPAPLDAKVGGIFKVVLPAPHNCTTIQTMDKIGLLVEGIDTGLHPLNCDPASNSLVFKLQRNAAAPATSDAAWEVMLGKPWGKGFGVARPLKFTVTQSTGNGVEDLQTGVLNLHLLPRGKTILGIVMILAIWGTLFYLATHSGIIRDAGNAGTTLEHRSYSLGRTQMAWWFAIIVPSYIFLWVVTDGLPSLSTQALALMGISGAAGLVSAGLDKGKDMPVSSGKFFADLLTDADGVTLHRFQMLAMTVVLGCIYFVTVFSQLEMPTFDDNTLAMLGISGLTYLGFKVPEKPGPAADEGRPADNAADPKAGYAPLPDSTQP